MKVASKFATALSMFALISTGSIAASGQSNTSLDQINVDGANKKTDNEKYDGTILEDPAVGVPSVVITQEDIERINPKDLQDVFNQETSVVVGGSQSISQKIFVLGIEDKRLAVTKDGAIQKNDLFHHTTTLLIDPSLLKAARVDPGVAPADAGPGALGGSIQFETVDVKDLLEAGKSFGGFVTVSYDTNSETFATGVSGYTMSNGFEVLGYYKYTDGENFEDGDGFEQIGTGAALKSALGKVAYEAQSGDRLEFSYEWVNDDNLRPHRPNLIVLGGTADLTRKHEIENNNFVLSYTDEKPQGWWDPKLVLAYSEAIYRAADLGQTEVCCFADIETWSGKFENKFKLAQGDVVAGIDFFDTDSWGGYIDFMGGDFRQTEKDRNLGAYAQARLDVTKEFRVSFGGRIDHQMFTGIDGTELDDAGFSGNISAEYDLNDIFTLKGGYAHVFGRIPLAEAYLNFNNYDYSNLDTYNSDNFTVGLSADYRGFTFDVNYSIIKMDDAIGHNSGFTSAPFRSVLDIESKAFDVSLGYKWGSGFVLAKYTNTDIEGDGEVLWSNFFGFGTNIGELISISAEHKFEGTGITIGGDIQIALEQDDVNQYWLSSFGDPTPTNPIPSYEVVNAYIQYELENTNFADLTLRAEVNNIFDETYSNRASSGQEYNAYYRPLNELGRSLYLSAKAKF